MTSKELVRESALVILVMIAAYGGIVAYRSKSQGHFRLSVMDTFTNIRIGMNKGEVTQLLRANNIDCTEGKEWGTIRYCSFEDPWRHYVVDFDESAVVSSIQVQAR